MNQKTLEFSNIKQNIKSSLTYDIAVFIDFQHYSRGCFSKLIRAF